MILKPARKKKQKQKNKNKNKKGCGQKGGGDNIVFCAES
jgi:hypothetical protein